MTRPHPAHGRYLGEELTREEVMARLDELLAVARRAMGVA